MDPLAHTLVGAALAEAGLKRLSRYATATLLIGANLPDIDVIANLWGHDTALYFRRGWSHGIIAFIVLPILLATVMWLWHRWRGQSSSETPRFRLGAVIALSFLAVLSHPLLDWLNTYGVRLLMPFDDRWFYGDTLFIVDPWLWLLAAAGVVLARSGNYPAIVGWILLAAVATILILSTSFIPFAVKLIWFGALAAIVVLRWQKRSQARNQTIARASAATLIIYVCSVYGMARTAESIAAVGFAAPLEAQSNPVPGVPFSHRVVLVYDTVYRVIAANGEVYEIPREKPDRIVQAALESDSIRGFVNWMRFPYWKVEETPNSWIVRFWDLRYQGPDVPQSGIGFAQVEVPKNRNRDR